MEPTAKELVDFLNRSAKNGMLPSATAGALRAAVTEVLKHVVGDGWEAEDVSKVDVDDYTERFVRLRASAYKPDTLLVYKSRFKNAVGMFLDWQKNPVAWRYRAARPSAERTKPKKPGQDVGTNASTGDVVMDPSLTPPAPSGAITYPYPLRPGLRASLVLPEDLTREEAKRLAVFIESLAVVEPLRLGAGRPEAADTVVPANGSAVVEVAG